MAKIALTTGDPGGIGPDLCVLLAATAGPIKPIVVGDPELLEVRARRLGRSVQLDLWQPGQPLPDAPVGHLPLWPVGRVADATPGQLHPDNASYVLETIAAATRACLDGTCDALVTGPVSKANINDAGIAFSGHTEYLAELTGGDPVMLLMAPGLRVALVTTHLPLSEVSAAITEARVERITRILHRDLRSRFGIEDPLILVAGLNPHAGEGGHLGHEEMSVIGPVLERLRQQGMRLEGPLPADTLFLPPYLARADAVLAMYHDQGLPVLKHLGFGRAVNVTLGLPIIRTSVDHGTALDLAGTGAAETGSLLAAIEAARDLVAYSSSANGFAA